MKPGTASEMSTLVSCMNHLRNNGYTENFTVDEKGIKTQDIKKHYKPEQVSIENFYRFEGNTDPADEAILYAIETNDGLRGVISDSYGPYADRFTGAFMKKVQALKKERNFSRKRITQPPMFS